MTSDLVSEVVRGHEEIGGENVSLRFNFFPESVPGVHVFGGAFEFLLQLTVEDVVSEFMSNGEIYPPR